MSVLKKTYTPINGYTEVVRPGELGITKLHFGILSLAPGETFFDHSDDTEVTLVALGGRCTLLVGHSGNKAYGILGERADVFNGEAGMAYIPHHTTYELPNDEIRSEIAVCKVASHVESAAVILAAGERLDENATRLRIWERWLSADSQGSGSGTFDLPTERETVCLHKFRDMAGVVLLDVECPAETTRVRLYHNDVLTVPADARIAGLRCEGVGYQLWIQPVSNVKEKATP